METVDIGGAASNGRPRMPVMTTVEFTDDGTLTRVRDTAYDAVQDVSYEAGAAPPKPQISDAVRQASHPGAQILYPEEHPANDAEIALGGGILVKRGYNPKVGKPLGDVRTGYVTGQRKEAVYPEQVTTPMEEATEQQNSVDYEEEIAKLKEEVATAKESDRPNVMENQVGEPVIKASFTTDMGTIASYYHLVEHQGNLLILATNNEAPVSQTFVPKSSKDDNDSPKPLKVEVQIEKDGPYKEFTVVVLDVNFTIGIYDVVVLLVTKEGEINHGEA